MGELTGTVAITGGRVVPIDAEPIEGGTVLVVDGTITAVGTDVEIPDGTAVVDATGRWVLPGFVDAHAHVGVHEEGESGVGNDTNEMTDPNGARFRRARRHQPRRHRIHRRAVRRGHERGRQTRQR